MTDIRNDGRPAEQVRNGFSARHATAAAATGVFVAVAMGVFIQVAGDSLGFWHWGDEDEKIVAAWMIAEGYRLYGDLFAHHGPLNYALAHLTYLASGSTDLAPYRVLQWATVLLAGAILAASPLLRGWSRRLLAFGLFCLLVALLSPLWYGHTLLYHSLGGVSMSIALSLLLLPVIFGTDPGSTRAGAGGAALSAAIFAAYPFAVSIVLLGLAAALLVRARGMRWRDWTPTLIAATAGFAGFTLLMLVWLLCYGDLVGYGLYHFWFNQTIYTQFIDFQPGTAWRQLGKLFHSPLGWVLWAVLLFCVLTGIETQAAGARGRGGAQRLLRWFWLASGCAVLLSGLLFLNPRGEEVFKNAALWIVGLGLLSLLIVWTPSAPVNRTAVGVLRGLAVLVVVAAPIYLIGIKGWSDVDARYVTGDHAARKLAGYRKRIDLVQALVPPGEPILAMVFSPRWYLLTKRPPSSGAYYYLPWQAAYNRAPVLGAAVDPCVDLAEAPPKVMAWDRWKVWGHYDVAEYAPCLVEVMERDYVSITRTPLLLRKPVSDSDRAVVEGFGYDLEPLKVHD